MWFQSNLGRHQGSNAAQNQICNGQKQQTGAWGHRPFQLPLYILRSNHPSPQKQCAHMKRNSQDISHFSSTLSQAIDVFKVRASMRADCSDLDEQFHQLSTNSLMQIWNAQSRSKSEMRLWRRDRITSDITVVLQVRYNQRGLSMSWLKTTFAWRRESLFNWRHISIPDHKRTNRQ